MDPYDVTVTLRGGDRELIAVLNALEEYVTGQGCTVRIDFGEYKYAMH